MDEGTRACTACGEAMAVDRSVCPACGTLQRAADPSTSPAPGPVAGAVGEDDSDDRHGFGVRAGLSEPVSREEVPPPPIVIPTADAPGGADHRPWAVWGVVAAVVGVIALTAIVLVAGSDGDVLGTPTTTTQPRQLQARALSEYCDLPGEAWTEVPAYEAGEPVRTQVRFLGGGVDNAMDRRNEPSRSLYDPVTLGSTELSPGTDGEFSKAAADREDVRAVTCVTHVGMLPVNEACFYQDDPTDPESGYRSYLLARNRYRVAVFELHSGDILHEGTIETEVEGCPKYLRTDRYTPQIAWGLRPAQILTWFDENFVDGEPV